MKSSKVKENFESPDFPELRLFLNFIYPKEEQDFNTDTMFQTNGTTSSFQFVGDRRK